MDLSDTTPAAREVYLRRLAEMTPAERTWIAASLWETANRVQHAVMRQRHPEASEHEIKYRIAVTRFGPELAAKAYQRE